MDVPRWAAAAAVLLLGLAAGSVAGLLVARNPIRPRRQPPQVSGPQWDGPLQPGDLIPLTGWLRLRSRSPACRAELGVWFPAAELMTAGLFVAPWFRFGPSPALPAAGQKQSALDQLAARHRVTHLGMPDFRPAAGRSSSADG